MCSATVHPANQVPEVHGGHDVLHVAVGNRAGFARRRAVEEHQEDAGHRQQDEQEEREAT
jgi:hypothetical protein